MSIFKIFVIFGAVSTWAEKAFADGKVSAREYMDLGEQLAAILGIPLEHDIPGFDTRPDDQPPVATAPETPEPETATETRPEKPAHKPIGGYTT